ncbi:MAG: response regulator transcription factor [Chlorobi bacterium]|nr:response regulator transcription factor [Chlorobiota bacterium]
MKKLSCYIIDDEKGPRERMAMLLQKFDDISIVGIEGEPEKAIESIISKKPDLVFIDVEMPRCSGFDMIKAIREKNVSPEFIFVTGYNTYAIKAIRNGAFDFLVKPVDIDELSDAIRRYREKHQQKNGVGSSGNLAIVESFSERELEIVRLISACKDTRQIAEELNISKNTVDTHRKNILEKAGLRKTTELIVFALENGLR